MADLDAGTTRIPAEKDRPARHRPAATPAELAAALGQTGYLADEDLATVVWLALRMRRPILLEGEPGTGKTALAEAVATTLSAPLVRLQCYEGIDASQALYDWDFPRQLLHLRALEAARGSRGLDVDEVEQDLFGERFLLARPVLKALRSASSVLLVDEIDRADDEFEALLLEVLSTNAVTVPEVGTIYAQQPPLIVLTSNRTRELHDALKRRCLYHWVEHPDLEREIQIIRTRLPDVPERLAEQVARAVQQLRRTDLLKSPGVAESLDWATALHALGRDDLDPAVAAATLGTVLKYKEDADRVRPDLARLLAK